MHTVGKESAFLRSPIKHGRMPPWRRWRNVLYKMALERAWGWDLSVDVLMKRTKIG